MKFLFDFFPIILFFVAYRFGDIYMATAVAIGATVLQIAFAKLVLKKVEPMMWMSAGIVVFFGGLTLLLHNPTFIKWKPTVLYWAMAAALAIGAWVFKRNFIRKMMEEQIKLPDRLWGRLNAAWVLFLGAMGVLNLIVAYQFSESVWVNFKVFGTTGLMLVFVVVQVLMVSRHAIEDSGKTP